MLTKNILNEKDSRRYKALNKKAFAYYTGGDDLTAKERQEFNKLRKKMFRTIEDEFKELAKMFKKIDTATKKKVKARKARK